MLHPALCYPDPPVHRFVPAPLVADAVRGGDVPEVIRVSAERYRLQLIQLEAERVALCLTILWVYPCGEGVVNGTTAQVARQSQLRNALAQLVSSRTV